MVNGWSDGDVRPRGYVESRWALPPTRRFGLRAGRGLFGPGVRGRRVSVGRATYTLFRHFVRGAGWVGVGAELKWHAPLTANAVHPGARAGAPSALGSTYNVCSMQSLGFTQSASLERASRGLAAAADSLIPAGTPIRMPLSAGSSTTGCEPWSPDSRVPWSYHDSTVIMGDVARRATGVRAALSTYAEAPAGVSVAAAKRERIVWRSRPRRAPFGTLCACACT